MKLVLIIETVAFVGFGFYHGVLIDLIRVSSGSILEEYITV